MILGCQVPSSSSNNFLLFWHHKKIPADVINAKTETPTTTPTITPVLLLLLLSAELRTVGTKSEEKFS
jgi:hypothetical protein